MGLILIEGIPGAGKSSLARQLCNQALSSGQDAKWYLEEARDHPVRKASANPESEAGFAEECLAHWRTFAQRISGDRTLHVLEGTAFQSSVRFMLEREHGGIAEYFAQFEEIVRGLSPALIYLRPRNALEYSRLVSAHRGEIWSGKVSAYLERTHYCKSRGLAGLEGMHRFWANYAEVCDELIAATKMPTKIIEVCPANWDDHVHEAQAHLIASGYLPEREIE